jgi:hypothetical protein
MRRTHALYASFAAALTAVSLLSGCPTPGKLGNLTFDRLDDDLLDVQLDGEAGDSASALNEGRWAVGSSLRLRVASADANEPLPNLDCHSEDMAVFSSTFIGADEVDLAAVGEGTTRVECHDEDRNGAVVDFLSISAAAPAGLAVWHRVPFLVPNLRLDVTGTTLQMLEFGSIDLALEMQDAVGGHLRGNIPVNVASSDVTVSDLVCDTGVNSACASNQFWVLSASYAGSADVAVSLSSDAAVGASIPVDVFGVADVTGVGFSLVDSTGATITQPAAAADGAVLIATALLGDGTEAWGGDYTFTVLTPATLAVGATVPPTAAAYAVTMDVLQTGMASVQIELTGSGIIGTADFAVVAN